MRKPALGITKERNEIVVYHDFEDGKGDYYLANRDFECVKRLFNLFVVSKDVATFKSTVKESSGGRKPPGFTKEQ